jgi:hypothetical protein
MLMLLIMIIILGPTDAAQNHNEQEHEGGVWNRRMARAITFGAFPIRSLSWQAV